MTNQPEVHEFHFTEALRNVAKYRPADVSAIGVSILIDHVEELESENQSIRHILSLWKKTEAMKEIDRLNTMLKSKDIVIASQVKTINELTERILKNGHSS